MRKKILLIESDKFQTMFYGDVLSSNGYEVVVSNNADDSVFESKFDVVIADEYTLQRDGMIEMIQKIRASKDLKSMPAIVLSSDLTRKKEKELLGLGYNRFIEKPSTVNNFISIVDEVCSSI